MHHKVPLLVCLLSVCVISVSHSQDDFLSPNHLVDSTYYEGYRKQHNTDAHFKLISFTAHYTEGDSLTSEYFNMGFHVPIDLANKELDVFVEDRKDESYYMLPIQNTWPEGYHIFRWSCLKANERDIGLNDLFGVAKQKRSYFAERVIPITFFNLPHSTIIDNYEIVFLANRRVDLRYTIFDAMEQQVASDRFYDQPKNTNIVIKWDCRDAEPGTYIVKVEYWLKNGEIISSETAYQFQHTK